MPIISSLIVRSLGTNPDFCLLILGTSPLKTFWTFFLFLKHPSSKLCRLLLSFFKAIEFCCASGVGVALSLFLSPFPVPFRGVSGGPGRRERIAWHLLHLFQTSAISQHSSPVFFFGEFLWKIGGVLYKTGCHVNPTALEPEPLKYRRRSL